MNGFAPVCGSNSVLPVLYRSPPAIYYLDVLSISRTMALQAFIFTVLFAARAQAQQQQQQQEATSRNLHLECSSSHSQGREEETVINAFFKGKFNGMYVELGALDGLNLSNTLKLASCFGWSGLLIEASSESFDALQRNLVRRPSGITKAVHGAVCPSLPDGSPQFINITQHGGAAAGNPLTMSDSHLKHWFKTSDVTKVPIEKVPCMPMETYLTSFKGVSVDEKGTKHIDFLSLDVEGSEYAVLSTIDFSTTQIDVLSIELQQGNKNSPACRELLADKGFIECDFLREITVLVSFVFVHKSSDYECPQRASWGFEGPPAEHFIKSGRNGHKRTMKQSGKPIKPY